MGDQTGEDCRVEHALAVSVVRVGICLSLVTGPDRVFPGNDAGGRGEGGKVNGIQGSCNRDGSGGCNQRG